MASLLNGGSHFFWQKFFWNFFLIFLFRNHTPNCAPYFCKTSPRHTREWGYSRVWGYIGGIPAYPIL